MPLFFLNVRDGDVLEDPEGVVAADADAARDVAIRGARDIIAEEVRAGEVHLSEMIEVLDERGKVVATVPFRDAFVIAD